MKTTSLILLVLKAAAAATLLFLSTTILFGQEKEKVEKLDKLAHKVERMKNKEFCSGDNWSNGSTSARQAKRFIDSLPHQCS